MAPSKKKAKTATRRKATKKKATRRTSTTTTGTVRRKAVSRRRVASSQRKTTEDEQRQEVSKANSEESAVTSSTEVKPRRDEPAPRPETPAATPRSERVQGPRPQAPSAEMGRSDTARNERPRQEPARPAPPRAAPPPRGRPMRALGKGVPPPFVVARGEDPKRVMDEALKYAGLFDRLEIMLEQSGKPREMFEIAAKVDFLFATRVEENPCSYVDPRLVTHLFDQLLDRGFRLLRVVETRNELLRYHANRSVKEVGRAIGYDESCYELWDMADDLYPVAYSGTLGNLPTGRIWHDADCRLVIAKNRTHEMWGPHLLLANLYSTLAVPTTQIALERGFDPTQFVLGCLEEVPVHFGIIEAVHSRDGSPGRGGPYDLLTDPEGHRPEGPVVLPTDTILAGHDILAVEAAGLRMQGVDAMTEETFKVARRSSGYKVPAEVEDLPMHEGWQSLGNQIRELLDIGKPAEAYRYGLWLAMQDLDRRLFPPQAGAFGAVRLKGQVEAFLEEVRSKRGLVAAANGTTD